MIRNFNLKTIYFHQINRLSKVYCLLYWNFNSYESLFIFFIYLDCQKCEKWDLKNVSQKDLQIDFFSTKDLLFRTGTTDKIQLYKLNIFLNLFSTIQIKTNKKIIIKLIKVEQNETSPKND